MASIGRARARFWFGLHYSYPPFPAPSYIAPPIHISTPLFRLSMCRICTDSVESLVEVDELNCHRCPDLVSIPPELVNLRTLWCYCCPRLVSIPATLTRLTRLDCTGCPLLVSLPPELASLVRLDCSRCPVLASIPPTLVHLHRLDCSDCPLVASIPATLTSLVELYCYRCTLLWMIPSALIHLNTLYAHGCPRLVSIPDAIDDTACDPCPWLVLRETRLPSVLRLQRWFRTGRKQTFKRWIRTRAFNEWIFHPDRIGGKLVKRQMEAELGAMRPTKQQRTE